MSRATPAAKRRRASKAAPERGERGPTGASSRTAAVHRRARGARSSASKATAAPRRCVLLFSGGIDSTLCALQLADEGYEVHMLSVHYERRPRSEARAARRVAKALRFVTWHETRLRGLAFGPPPGAPSDRESLEGVIAHRNLLFWSLAANRAATLGARTIAAGHTREDARTFSDAAPQFFRRLRTLLGRSGVPGDEGIEVRLPLQEFGSRHWRGLMERHRAVIAATWSCWRDGDGPCGRCFACRQRERVTGDLFRKEPTR